MKAVVVYESLWGNTAAAARAIAQGIGPEVRALSTAEATGEALAKPTGFTVKGRYGPLRKGELERARLWGAELVQAME